MSKKCIWCGGKVIGIAGSGYYCPQCDDNITGNEVRQMTVFDLITKSPETLAQELVTLDCDGWWAYIGIGKRKTYRTREEAIAATVAKLKKVGEE